MSQSGGQVSSIPPARSLSFRHRAAILAVAVLGLAGLALCIGPHPVAPGDVIAVLWAHIGGSGDVDPTLDTIVWQIRLPRVAIGLAIGAALAGAGSAYQGLFRNPLVSPDILGVSAGASFGAVIGIFLSMPAVAIQALAFVTGLGAVALVYTIGSAVRQGDAVLYLVLTGMAVAALLGAAISLLKVLADPYNQLPAITFWLLGSLAAANRDDALAALPAIFVGLAAMLALRWRINLLSLDDEEARALGAETGRLRIVLVVAATLVTAAAVSVSGIIGWIGLLVPHAARMLFGPEYSRLLPASILLGAAYLVIIDALARSLAAVEIPLGILTAALGAPVFLWLLASGRRGWA